MPKQGKTTEFWKRLTLARTTCKPPKSMIQDDIARDYDAAHQSTVTKWKTGGPKGDSMPSPAQIMKIALDTNVNVNWLWAGQGEMRPSRSVGYITMQIIEAVEELDEPAKFEVFKSAITQQAMRNPGVAERLSEVESYLTKPRDAKKAARKP
jgi:hypothetical protein